MRILLFSLSAILSGIMVFLSYQNLHNEIANVDFTLITLVTIIVLSFSSSHFLYRNHCNKSALKLSKQRLDTLEKNISELTTLKESLEKKVDNLLAESKDKSEDIISLLEKKIASMKKEAKK